MIVWNEIKGSWTQLAPKAPKTLGFNFFEKKTPSLETMTTTTTSMATTTTRSTTTTTTKTKTTTTAMTTTTATTTTMMLRLLIQRHLAEYLLTYEMNYRIRLKIWDFSIKNRKVGIVFVALRWNDWFQHRLNPCHVSFYKQSKKCF